MAERGRTVRVTGLPTELKEDRLEDKLCIHFQRGRNGGGEVVSVTAVKTSSDFALVTFEDSRVAQRVIQQNQHILEVDGKSYNLIVNEHSGGRDQDKVIVNLSATVDCSQLSGAKRTLKDLIKSHPDVKFNYNSARELCTLSGSYSKVQAALAQLFGQPEPPRTAEDKDLKTSADNKPNQPTPSPRSQVSHDQSRSLKDKRDKPLVEKHTYMHREVTPGGYDREDTSQVKGATASSPSPEEDFSLMVDADMFQYLQKYCSEEYHQILRQHGVAVVDFTHQGLTTLLLQVASGDGVHDQECLRKARMQISQLYEENQANVCRDKLSKSIIPNREGLKRAIEKLGGRFTKLLFNEDEQHVYIIGSRDDVAEAKKFLLLYDHSGENKTDVTSPRRFQDAWPGEEVKVPSASLTNHGSLDNNGLDQAEDEGKLEGSGRVRLAAQFKDPRIPPLGSKTTDFTVRGHSHSNKQTRHSPMLGYDVLSDTKGNSYVKVGAQNTGGDILFKSGDASLQTTDVLDTRPKASTVSPTQSDGLGTPSPAASGSSLRRASSFSGVTKKRDQEISPKSDTDTGISRGRSSSLSSGSKQEQHSAEITVNGVMWRHITKAFKPLMEELTSEVQYREKSTDRGRDITILLTGTNSSKVASCKQGLQRLIDSVKVDFIIRSLKLSELGITDATNEALQACCAEIRSLYKKISMEIYDNSLYLFGPQVLCSQVCESLREVFSGAQIYSQQNYSRSLTSSGSDSYRYSLSPAANGETGKAGVKDGSKRRDLRETELVNGSIGQVSPRRDAVIKEKVKRPDSLETDARNAQESVKSGSINGSVTTRADKNKTRREQTGGDRSMAATGGPVCTVCGRAGVQVKRTQCGETICSDCWDKVHSQCRACELIEQSKLWGIKGKMTYSNLPMSIPGYIKDPVVKITYQIPDGIQGEGHPSPGKPFKGGLFEAFLPDCEQTRKLLPRLQEAFNRGHTFTVTGGKVSWDNIPHKTSLQGGKSASGYPDSTYLSRLSDVLNSLGI